MGLKNDLSVVIQYLTYYFQDKVLWGTLKGEGLHLSVKTAFNPPYDHSEQPGNMLYKLPHLIMM